MYNLVDIFFAKKCLKCKKLEILFYKDVFREYGKIPMEGIRGGDLGLILTCYEDKSAYTNIDYMRNKIKK